ncbi:glycosyltransferase family 4 protein [Terriglobus albidus]|uniref:glycosyltransferase family 4 protein n=1 Tax=Terriglobus albidus TaxID=1592106 RepID=UPI0021E0C1D8|nr:glycosyltransferase family 4 protein [Terriglobus albidus]
MHRSISWRSRSTIHGYKDESYIHLPLGAYWQLSLYRPQVIITSEFGLRSISAVLYRLFHPESKVILWATLSQRTEAARNFVRRFVRRFILQNVDRVFVNGRDGEEYIRSMGFLGTVDHIPYVVDTRAFSSVRELKADSDVIALFHVGQLIERKGILEFCEILQVWCAAHPGMRLRVRLAGSGPLLSRLQELGRSSLVPIDFLGHLTLDSLVQEYCQASILVFPTYADEWGVVVNEALSAGVPVMGSKYSQAVMELIDEGKNGWTFDPTERESVLDALDRALTKSPADIKAMAEFCQRSVQELTPENVAKRIYDSIMETSS